jgi:hypothetical protein
VKAASFNCCIIYHKVIAIYLEPMNAPIINIYVVFMKNKVGQPLYLALREAPPLNPCHCPVHEP